LAALLAKEYGSSERGNVVSLKRKRTKGGLVDGEKKMKVILFLPRIMFVDFELSGFTDIQPI
jgi:hypothetical protein